MFSYTSSKSISNPNQRHFLQTAIPPRHRLINALNMPVKVVSPSCLARRGEINFFSRISPLQYVTTIEWFILRRNRDCSQGFHTVQWEFQTSLGASFQGRIHVFTPVFVLVFLFIQPSVARAHAFTRPDREIIRRATLPRQSSWGL